MKNFINNSRFSNRLILVLGLMLLYLQLRKHPEDWLQRLGEILFWIFASISVLYIIYYIKNRNLKN